MTSGLEDKMIAYFDGGLSDADSAELLHLASVSPEIRDLFREHEMLRDLAHEATRSATVSPEVESSLFSRIKDLAETPVRKKAMLIFSRRTALVAALALVLLSGSLGYLLPKFFSNASSLPTASTIRSISQTSPLPVAASMMPAQNSDIKNLLERRASSTPVERSTFNSDAPRWKESDQARINDQVTRSTDLNAAWSNIAQPAEISIPAIQPAHVREEDIHSDLGNEKLSPFDLKEMPSEQRSLFEASLQTSSGFTYPANSTPIAPFADQRLSFAFHITENNLIGFRLGSGLYQQLGAVTTQQENGVEVLTRGIETKRSFSEELFLSHLVPVFFVAPFTLEFALDGGFIPNGYSLGAEAGIRIPLSEAFMFDVAFALSRIHSNALTSGQILNSVNAGMQPVLLESVDIHNTLNGRLHYGLLYRF